MLPPKVIETMVGFVLAYDLSHPKESAFGDAYSKAVAGRGGVAKGYYEVGRLITASIRAKAEFVLEKAKDTVAAYHGCIDESRLTADLRELVSNFITDDISAATKYMHDLQNRTYFRGGLGRIEDPLMGCKGILPNADAEINLFCEKLRKMNSQTPIPGTVNIYGDGNAVGSGNQTNVNKSPSTVINFDPIRELMIEKEVPIHLRHELEVMVEELNSAPPEQKMSVTDKIKDWFVRNVDFVGACAEGFGRFFDVSFK